ncbi:alpha/beta hydrolase [uncultured Rhodoferax sp.]|uniref:alpha/beta hydrolase n=1 Tax=uncultured Rhodoferax sp. TaxID=223188 RepID=UPI0025DBF0B6|nr:alpha/beta hydrolase [uncultured Rhodoferax sp.]
MWKFFGIAAVLTMTGLSPGGVHAQTPEVVDLPTRPGVTVRYLWQSPAQARAAVILLVGGNGGVRLGADGSLGGMGGNFLARTRAQFVQQGLAVALMDAPSDRQAPPFLSGFRQTPEHVVDLKALIADVRQRSQRPVALVGTSRGTQSAAAAAIALAESGGPDALVLTSTILTDPQSRAVPKMAVDALRIPVLVMHHQQDGCKHCAVADLPALLDKLPAGYQVRMYEGGNNVGDPCEAMAYHGFNGLEARVVQDLSAWLLASVAR